ncbi:MAG: hypothetical protein WC852_00010 [Candidatus Nanoarchaeia archaeon]|jgi:hypothetical protein
MDVEKQSEEEFEIFLENNRKKTVKNKIILGIGLIAASAGIYSLSAYALCKNAEYVRDSAIEASVPRLEKSIIERLNAEVTNPLEAFAMIDNDIDFLPKFDESRFLKDYWSSLQETYGLMKGDCEDGAIAFKALLLDNPEYQVELVSLNKRNNIENSGHMAAAYRDANTQNWGIVSFNTFKDGEFANRLLKPIHRTLNEAVEAYAKGRFDSWNTVEISNENLKFGRNLADDVESISEEHRL